MLTCKRLGCDRAAARDQVYCSKEHAPYGMLLDAPVLRRVERGTGLSPEAVVVAIKTKAFAGASAKEAARELNYHPTWIRELAKRNGIKFRRSRLKETSMSR